MFTFSDPSLYQLTAKDLAGGPRIQRFVGSFAPAAAAAASVTSATTFTVPPSIVRILKGVSVLGTPGAAQFFEGMQLLCSLAGTLTQVVEQSPPTRTAAVGTYIYALLDLVMFPGEVATLAGVFNAGVAANSISGFVWGYDIPRANIAP